jgi:hypothetical protein
VRFAVGQFDAQHVRMPSRQGLLQPVGIEGRDRRVGDDRRRRALGQAVVAAASSRIPLPMWIS